MQWCQKDIQQYNEAEQYVDTLVIPLMPMAVNQQMDKLGFQGELLKLYVNGLEQHYKGRLFLMPTYAYFHPENDEQEINRLNTWIAEMKQKPFEHVFLFSFDSFWKKHERKLDGTLLWVPAMQTGNLDDSNTKVMMNDQLKEIIGLIKSFW
ncbi:DUF2487 family protein [Radiobacillus sp. PE A8.2]|uniref:DUF2487 family protein n=1 Tax=Radiobacillus sp. PE A8.2 TaxID=3380349 RepID=UPI00388FC21D